MRKTIADEMFTIIPLPLDARRFVKLISTHPTLLGVVKPNISLITTRGWCKTDHHAGFLIPGYASNNHHSMDSDNTEDCRRWIFRKIGT